MDADDRLGPPPRRRRHLGPVPSAVPARPAGHYPVAVLAAAVLAAEGVSFVLVGSAALATERGQRPPCVWPGLCECYKSVSERSFVLTRNDSAAFSRTSQHISAYPQVLRTSAPPRRPYAELADPRHREEAR